MDIGSARGKKGARDKARKCQENLFLDDKIVSNRACPLMLFKAFIPLELRVGRQAPLNLGKDEELLHNPMDFLGEKRVPTRSSLI